MNRSRRRESPGCFDGSSAAVGSRLRRRAGVCRSGDPAAAITCQSRMGRQVRGYVNREAGFKGAEASQQDAVAEAGDRDQGSAPQGQRHAVPVPRETETSYPVPEGEAEVIRCCPTTKHLCRAALRGGGDERQRHETTRSMRSRMWPNPQYPTPGGCRKGGGPGKATRTITWGRHRHASIRVTPLIKRDPQGCHFSLKASLKTPKPVACTSRSRLTSVPVQRTTGMTRRATTCEGGILSRPLVPPKDPAASREKTPQRAVKRPRSEP